MSVVAPEQLAAVGVVAAPEAAEGLAAVEAGVEGVKVAVRGAGTATAIVGAREGVVVGMEASRGVVVEAGASGGAGKTAGLPCPPPMLLKLAAKPLLSTEPSAPKVTSIDPVVDRTAGGGEAPEKWPRSGDPTVPPSYTSTKSYPASVRNAEKLRLTALPAWMSHEQRMFGA